MIGVAINIRPHSTPRGPTKALTIDTASHTRINTERLPTINCPRVTLSCFFAKNATKRISLIMVAIGLTMSFTSHASSSPQTF